MGDQSSSCTDSISKKILALAETHEKTRENAYVTFVRNILNFHMAFFLEISEEFVHLAKK